MAFVRTVRMRVPAGTAKPGPAIGQALGPLGINMMDFCKKFNEETKHILPKTPMPCVSYAVAASSDILVFVCCAMIHACHHLLARHFRVRRAFCAIWDVCRESMRVIERHHVQNNTCRGVCAVVLVYL